MVQAAEGRVPFSCDFNVRHKRLRMVQASYRVTFRVHFKVLCVVQADFRVPFSCSLSDFNVITNGFAGGEQCHFFCRFQLAIKAALRGAESIYRTTYSCVYLFR